MKSTALLVITAILFAGASCKKDKNGDDIYGTVIQKGGCNPNSWLVRIENPERAEGYFCDPALAIPSSGYDCTNSFFIDLPDHLAIAGRRIYFDIEGTSPTCLSSSAAPAHADVSHLR